MQVFKQDDILFVKKTKTKTCRFYFVYKTSIEMISFDLGFITYV